MVQCFSVGFENCEIFEIAKSCFPRFRIPNNFLKAESEMALPFSFVTFYYPTKHCFEERVKNKQTLRYLVTLSKVVFLYLDGLNTTVQEGDEAKILPFMAGG